MWRNDARHMQSLQTVTKFEAKQGAVMEKIGFSGVGKSFSVRAQEVRALQPIDLQVQAQEFVALVGPSGCGKSTLLNLVAGLLQPSEGVVTYDQKPVQGLNFRVGYMTQKDTLLPWRTAADNIGIALELRCRSVQKKEAQERIAEMVELVDLRGFENHYPAELSGGMKKRVALARTLIYEPETLLMDEPFGALDAQLKLIMQDQLQRITQHRRMTVLFVTHDLGEAVAVADRVVVFSGRPGRIRAIRDVTLPRPRDIYKIRFTDAFSRLHEDLWNELKDEVIKGSDV
jgi:NitT/TauT family transport system ATP-binding protein